MSNAIKVVAILLAKPGKGEALKNALLACVPDSRNEPGCLFYHLHVDRADPQRFVFMEGWTDQDAIDFHQKTDHYQKMAAAAADLVEHREVLYLDEVSLG